VVRFRDTTTITVALPLDAAMSLFTARGERNWVAGWDPEFPAGEPTEEGEGTVFLTSAHGRSTYWVVVARTPRSVRYARVTPGLHAGTVEVCERGSDGRSTQVYVTYDLTALTPEGDAALGAFAVHYKDEIRAWEVAIEAEL
jgi:hypothetical protein